MWSKLRYLFFSEYGGLVSSTEYSRTLMLEALEIEDLEKQDWLVQYDVTNVQISIYDESEFSCSIDCVPPDVNELSLALIPMHLYKGERFIERSKCFFASVIAYDDETSFLFFTRNVSRLDVHQRYHLRFEYHRAPMVACYHALEQMKLLGLEKYFRDFMQAPPKCDMKKKGNSWTNLKFINQNIAQDLKQMTIVEIVLSERYFPFPYVITGGPGTGKTTIMIECVAQILKLKPKSHVLITAQSNSVCDEIGVRLLKYVQSKDVFRHYSRGQAKTSKDDYTKTLRKSSTISSGKFQTPSYSQLYSFRVVIVTMVASNRFITAGVKKNHFDFIFVDECCAAIEPECLVPIIGLGMENQKVNAKIILLGDSHLLGPMVESRFAADLGLRLSFLERVLQHQPQISATLDNNYRSHPEIARFSNECFYKNSMKMKVPTFNKHFEKFSSILPNQAFPIIFHNLDSVAEEGENSKSSKNDKECEEVVQYVKYLLQRMRQKDIGVASPYNGQVNLLREKLNNFKDISIGTAEFFQGREKPVMIISTVKTHARKHSDFFFSDPRVTT